jgi:type III secretion protein U
MAAQDDSGDKTEKPTPKRLREAHKRGDVARSRDLSSTVATLVWLLIFAGATAAYHDQLVELVDRSLRAMHEPFYEVVLSVGLDAFRVLLLLGAIPAVLAGLIGTLVEFLQVRGVFTFEKLKPDLNNLDPIQGIKRMFGVENIIEVAKSILKAIILIWVLVVLTRMYAQDLVQLIEADPRSAGQLWWKLSSFFVVWVLVFFAALSFGDVLIQHFQFMKKLKMSRRDILREYKEDEGDPYIKQRRKQLHQEWAEQNMLTGVRRSNVVVTNPTHLAVALRYEKGETVVPVVVAKGEDHLAKRIRETAEEEGIPIMRNVDLARALYAEVDMDDYIPPELFEAVAQVLLWARATRQAQDEGREPLAPPFA